MILTSRKRGLFISVEGGEGVGKSTFIDYLSRWIKTKHSELLVTREPGGTAIADALRAIFVNPPDPKEKLFPLAELMIVSAGRLQHVKNILEPGLAAGKWILCDRFADSAAVYQIAKVSEAEKKVAETIWLAGTDGLKPDLTFLLDCDVATSMKRLQSRSQKSQSDQPSRFDLADISSHESKRNLFLDLAKKNPERICILNAELEAESVFFNAQNEIEKRFPEYLSDLQSLPDSKKRNSQ